jgi:hypothetical protein
MDGDFNADSNALVLDWEDAVVAQVVSSNNTVITILQEEDNSVPSDVNIDPFFRNRPRQKKIPFRHSEGLHCINRDYLGLPDDPMTPLFNGVNFQMMFRVSRPRFQRLMEDIANSGIPFYRNNISAYKEQGSSLEAKLLLPLKSLAYEVPPHTFTDYFQMSMTLAKKRRLNSSSTFLMVNEW